MATIMVPADYPTLQAAINAASPGDTIVVAAGVYNESITINKSLTLEGPQAGVDARTRSGTPSTEAIIGGSGGVTPVDVTASNVVIDGFTIQGATNPNDFGTGILIGAGTSGTQILNNIVQDNITGLELANASSIDGTVISQNLFQNNNAPGPGSGTAIYSDQFVAGGSLNGVSITDNAFSDNNTAGIDLGFTSGASSGISVENNDFSNDSNAIFLSDVSDVTVNGSGDTVIGIAGFTGTVVLNGTDTYTGAITVAGGTLEVTGSIAQSAVTVDSGASLGGTGTTGAVTVDSGGTFAPGDPSTMTVASLTLDSGSNFDEEIGGASPGTGGSGGYDQTVVENGGTISLGDATFNLSPVNGFTPSTGEVFTIINNQTGNAVSGTFDGLPQGASFVDDGMLWQISYAGGSNNQDVTLTMAAFVVTNTNDSGPGSLRQAIINANTVSGATITFDIPGTGPQTITLLSALPAITSDITIDGTTQPSYAGSPVVTIDGTGAGANADGLDFEAGASNSAVEGLDIVNFGGAGINLISVTGVAITGNYIGVDQSGDAAAANGTGIELQVNADDNTIGGTNAGDGNVVSGNTGDGISLNQGADDNSVIGNLIGLDAAGTAALGNVESGIAITLSRDNTIGGTAAGAGNAIADNTGAGVAITASGSVGNAIEGNAISQNANGIEFVVGPPNGGQAAPVLTAVQTSATQIDIAGMLDSTANQTYRIEFFANTAADSNGIVEGETFLGATTVTTNGSGIATFDSTMSWTTADGDLVTATATNVTTGDTSEFSQLLVVTNLNDSGTGSLRAELALANAGGGSATITFASDLAGGTLTLTNGELDISSNVTIDGDIGSNGAPDITINANGNSRVLLASSGSSTLQGLVVEGGYSTNGGGIYVDRGAALTVTDSAFYGNRAGGLGGGIADLGTLTLINSTLSGNTSLVGGGVYSGGTLTLVDSTVVGNSASVSGGGIAGNGGPLSLTNVTLSGNSAVSGGGIAVYSGALTLYDSTLTGNHASKFGGGIYNFVNSGGTTLVNSIVAGNDAVASGSDLFGGGALPSLTLRGGNILGSAPTDFSSVTGSYTLINGARQTGLQSVFANVYHNSYTGVLSGALGLNGGPVETVALNPTGIAIDAGVAANLPPDPNNPAESLSTDARGFDRVAGGGLDLGAFQQQTPQTFVVTTLSDISSTNPNPNNLSLREALFLANEDPTTADTITFASNLTGGTIDLTLGQLKIDGNVTIDGGNDNITIDAQNSSRVFDAVHGTSTINGLTITGGSALGYAAGDGGAIQVGSSRGYGGANLTISNSTITGSTAAYGGGIAVNFGDSLQLTNDTIANNNAYLVGGGIANQGTLTLTNSTVSTNSAGYIGGGIASDGALTLTNSTLSGNQTGTPGPVLPHGYSDAGGGGLYSSGSATLLGTTVTGNTSAYAGGGILSDGELTLTNSTVSNNSAGYIGGGILNAGGLTLTNSTLSSNQITGAGIAPGGQPSAGAGLYNSGIAALSNTTVADNTGAYNGGGIYNSAGLTLINATIADNSADNGGGLANAACGCGNTGIYDSTLTGNDASQNGGGIYNANGVLTLTNSIVAGNGAGSQGPDVYASSLPTTTTNYAGVNLFSQAGVGRSGIDINVSPSNLSQVFNTLTTIDPTSGAQFQAGTLGNYGGPTLTVLITSGGYAQDAGNPGALPPDPDNSAEPLSVDARGLPRLDNGTLDIGAVELQPLISNPNAVIAAAGTGPIALDIAAPTDSDGSTPTIELDTVPTYGTTEYFNGATFVAASDGTMLTPAELASLEYTPPPSGEFGGQTITYTATEGLASSQGTIAVTALAEDTGASNLYFSAYGGPGNSGNPDLYTLDSNGNPVAIPLNIANGSSAGADGGFFQFAGDLYFFATTPTVSDSLFEMTPAGTVTPVSDGNGGYYGDPGENAHFTEFDGSLYFEAISSAGGDQLVKLNADGTSQVIVLNAGGQEAFPGQNGGFVEFDGDLYFSAVTTTTDGFNPDLIQLDPSGNVTEISTRSLANAQFGSSAGEDGGFYVFDNALYFNATSDTTLGDTLFELTAGSTTPVPVDPTGAILSHTFADGTSSAFHEFDGALYFNEFSTALGDDTLFQLSATGKLTALTYFNGTTNEALENAGASGGFADFAGSTYFVANTVGEGTQLFKLDAAGSITEITDTNGGAFDDNLPGNFVVFADNLYFDAYNGSGGDSLYQLAANGTLTAINLGDGLGTTQAGVDGGFQIVGNNLYFSAYTPNGYELVALGANGTVQDLGTNATPGDNSFDTAGDNNALGAFPDNIINGASGNDILVGSTPDEIIIGGSGSDIIEGRGGNDILTGGAGSTDFVFSLAGPSNVDFVTNYSLSQSDLLDVSALVDANFTVGSQIIDFVRLIASGSDLVLQVDPNGSADNPHVWQDVAVLENGNVAAVNQVTAVFAGTDQTITQTTDFTAPTVQSVVFSAPSSNVGVGALVTITVDMSEAVLVETGFGSPTLGLNDGGVAAFDAADSTSTALVFDYTVLAGQSTSGLATSSSGISLNGGTIEDLAANEADLTGSDNVAAVPTIAVNTGAPIVTPVSPNVNATASEIFAASSLFSASAGSPILSYEVEDENTGPSQGFWVLNGAVLTNGQLTTLTAAQLSELSFVAGSASTPVTDTLEVAASDAAGLGAFTTFTVTAAAHAPMAAPTVTAANELEAPNLALAGSSLFSGTAFGGNTVVSYEVEDTTTDSGHWIFNGTVEPTNQVIDVTAAQLSELSFATGYGVDTLMVRANDGTQWGNITTFTVTPPPNAAPPAGSSDTLVTLRRADGAYESYDIGHDTILLQYPLGQINPELQVAGVGGFNGTDTADLLMRDVTTGAFTLYDVSNDNITGNLVLGQVGLEWTVSGFGDFSGHAGETDMLMRDSNTGQFEVYDIANNAITFSAPMGQVGLEWSVAGFGDFTGRANETDMLMRNNNTGAFEVYDIVNNAITFASGMGQVGLEWQVAGFGDFSTRANETDMLMRNSNTGAFEVFDIVNNAITFAGPLGQVGLEWTIAGFGDFTGNANETDMLMRNSNTGAFELFNISNNTITPATGMGQIGLEWSISGVSATPASAPPSSATAQLTQAMASFAPSGGTAAASSPLGQAMAPSISTTLLTTNHA